MKRSKKSSKSHKEDAIRAPSTGSTRASSTSSTRASSTSSARASSTGSTRASSTGASEAKASTGASASKASTGASASKATTYSPRVFSQREQEDKLTGYLEIDQETWPQIRYATHIRYYLKTGEFRTGGFVLKNPFEVIISNDSLQNPKTPPEKLNKDKKKYIKLQNGFNEKLKGYYQWVVSYDDIEKIYIKPDAGVLTVIKTLETIVNGLNTNIEQLAASVRHLEKKIG